MFDILDILKLIPNVLQGKVISLTYEEPAAFDVPF